MICKTCYRDLPEEMMMKNLSGVIINECRTCCGIIGKGSGYSDNYSEEEANKWFEGSDERKKQLEKEGKL